MRFFLNSGCFKFKMFNGPLWASYGLDCCGAAYPLQEGKCPPALRPSSHLFVCLSAYLPICLSSAHLPRAPASCKKLEPGQTTSRLLSAWQQGLSHSDQNSSFSLHLSLAGQELDWSGLQVAFCPQSWPGTLGAVSLGDSWQAGTSGGLPDVRSCQDLRIHSRCVTSPSNYTQ